MSEKKAKEVRKPKGPSATVTYLDVWRSQGALPLLTSLKRRGPSGTESLQASISIKIARLVRRLREELLLIVPIHTGLIEKFGEEDPITKKKRVLQGTLDYDLFTQEFTEALNQEIPWDMDPVELPGDTQIDAAILLDLEKFIEVK